MDKQQLTQILIEEVKLIQEVIKKMSSNSFFLKGWTITLIVACIIGEKYDRSNLYLCFIPILVFWTLDAYFLRQERLYRLLYKWVIENRLNTDRFLFDLDTTRFIQKVGNIFYLMFSTTLFLFYGLTAVFVIILLLLIKP
jgi:hypothetical protein